MTAIDRRNLQAAHAFARLARLLGDKPPGRSPLPDGAPLAMSVGEPRRPPPDFVAAELAAAAAGWGRYPSARPDPRHLAAIAGWLQRRYELPDGTFGTGRLLDPERCLLPLPGSREGLFFAVLATVPATNLMSPGGPPPVVMIPNPFYHVYAGAVAAAGAEPVFVPATRETGFLPDYEAVDEAILERAALCFCNSPSNPQGAVADLAYLSRLIALARRHDFVVAFDECYSEIYSGAPPPGALQAAAALGGGLDKLLVFNSLSKRSSAPGLRCGFAAGPPSLIESLDGILRMGGAGVSQPVIAAGTRLWQEEDHVREARAHYQANFAVAERVLGNRFGFRKPAGGFFLWLDVGDGERAAVELWCRAGIRVLPGAYMAADGPNGLGNRGDNARGNPGAGFIRAALVEDAETTEAALARMVEVL